MAGMSIRRARTAALAAAGEVGTFLKLTHPHPEGPGRRGDGRRVTFDPNQCRKAATFD
jgi:hypothetical protein